MASSNKTPHYQLSQFAPTDKPAWQGDYNSDMKKIDNGIYAAQNKADSLDASVSEATNKATQALEKAEAAEDAAKNAAALAQEAKTTADNISGDLSGKVNKAGDTMTGPLVLPGDPTQPMEAATKQYVDQHGGGASGDFLPLSGGTMTGPITLAADPTTAMEAATKQYADKMLPLAGGTMTGALTLPADPTSDMQAATKKYVDNAVSGAGGNEWKKFSTTNSTLELQNPNSYLLSSMLCSIFVNGKTIYGNLTLTAQSIFNINSGSVSQPSFTAKIPGFNFDTNATNLMTAEGFTIGQMDSLSLGNQVYDKLPITVSVYAYNVDADGYLGFIIDWHNSTSSQLQMMANQVLQFKYTVFTI